MFAKSLSKTAGALALVGVVAPFIAQSVGAADDAALSGYANDPSGSVIINNPASADANGSGLASGDSKAGIGFKSGDLILYQVPNFDFSMNNKIADATYNMIGSTDDGKSNRMAVIVDNRYTAKATTENGNGKYNWKLSASAQPFMPQASTATNLTETYASLILNDTGSSEANRIVAKNVKSQNVKGESAKLYVPGTALTSALSIGQKLDILSGNLEVASSSGGENPGAVGLDFVKNNSAVFVVKANGISQIVPGVHYVSDINWTLTASPLH